jgi:hypothetical protein
MIAHGPSNKQYASKSDKFLIFKIFDLKSMVFFSSDPVLTIQ